MVTLGLVIGAAAGAFEEARAAMALQRPDLVYCVKAAGIHWPERFDFWCGLHPEWMADYEAQRTALGHPSGYQTVTCLAGELRDRHRNLTADRRVSYRWPGMKASASSGIFAAKVALEDCERVILAGVPMDGRPHFASGTPWSEHFGFMKGWQESVPHLQGRVRSMSGLTAKVLGEPSREWLVADVFSIYRNSVS